MNQLRAVVEAYQRLRADGVRLALATVVSSAGSVCRRPGARMLVTASGETVGCIGAGCMERDVATRARQVIGSGRPLLARYDANPETDIVWGLGLGCGGVTEVLIEPLIREEQAAHLAFLAACLERNQAGAIATIIGPDAEGVPLGSRLLLAADGTLRSVPDNGAFPERLVQDAAEVLRGELPAAVGEYDLAARPVKALVEVIRPPIALTIFGADQDAVPVVSFAAALGWRVTIVDSRAGLASAARFPGAGVIVCPPEQAAERARLDERTAALIMMHQYVWDMELLRTVLGSRAAYVGVLGPRQRTEGLLRHLGSRAAAQARGRLHAPVGLDIGAETSEEIALAIVAEIQAVFAGRAGGLLRERRGPIHDRPGSGLVDPEQGRGTE